MDPQDDDPRPAQPIPGQRDIFGEEIPAPQTLDFEGAA
jgi:hypothetical protein